MRKLLSVSLVLALVVGVLSLAGCGGKSTSTNQSGKEVKPIVMKLGHYAAASHPGHLAAQQFAANVEKRTNGAVKIQVFPDNQLGAPPEMLEQNILGAIDMSLPTQGALDKYSKKFAVVMLPFVFKDAQHAFKVLDGPFEKWAAPDLEQQGLVYLASWDYGFRNITNNVRAINSPDDVKGLKLRTPPEIQLQSAMEALGGIVTKIAFPELFMSLKQGVVDGQENPLAVIFHNKYYETQKHLALTNHVYNSMNHVISKKSWDKLTPEQQTIIKEESKKAAEFMRKQIASEEADLVKKLEEKGMKVTRPNPADFRAKMGPAYEKIAGYAGKENVDAFVKMADSVK